MCCAALRRTHTRAALSLAVNARSAISGARSVFCVTWRAFLMNGGVC